MRLGIEDDQFYDILVVSRFLLWLEREDPGAIWGGEKIDDVVRSFSNITGYDVALLKNMVSKHERKKDE